MRILLTSYGSAGDVHPFLAIAQALIARGHRVGLLLNPVYEARALALGAEFFPLGTSESFQALQRDPRLPQGHKGPLLFLRHLTELAPITIQALDATIQRFSPDLVLRYHIVFGARWVCEKLGVPCAVGVATPMQWFSALDRGRSCRPPVARIQSGLFRLALPLSRPVFYALVERHLHRIRHHYGFPREDRLYLREAREGVVNLGLWSPVFRPSFSDDPENGQITGFPYYDRPDGSTPSDESALRSFLAEGEAPVAFSLGSALVHCPGSFYDLARRACQHLDLRGVLLTGRPPSVRPRKGDSILEVGYANHSSLFPRCVAVVHHGGMGTTAQALRAGRPMVTVPYAFDQPDLADRAKRLGVAEIVACGKMTEERLTRALRNLLASDAPDRATAFANQLRKEGDGADRAAVLLESIGA